MKRRLTMFALPALALAVVLFSAGPSYAQRHSHGGSWGGGHGGWGRGGYGGYGHGYGGYGRGYGGYGRGYGGLGYGGLGFYGLGYGLGGYGLGGYGLGYGRGWGYGGYGYGGYGGYGYPSNYSAPMYYDNTYVYQPPVYVDGGVVPSSYQSLYPPNGTAQAPTDPNRAYIRVHVPADAQVYFENTATTQSGPDRLFSTPPLDPNQNYSYQISARWMQNGREVRQDRTVQLTPGHTVDVNFTSAPGSSSQPAQPATQFQQPATPAKTPNLTPGVNPGVAPAVSPGVTPNAPAPKQATPAVQPPL